jgi:putative ABC transport system ATP-binding protein
MAASPERLQIDQRVRGHGAAGIMVTHSAASAAIADRMLTLGAEGLVERRG